MLNSCELVGTVMNIEKGGKSTLAGNGTHVLLACDRPFMESDGSRKVDLFDVRVWSGAAEEMRELCIPGSIVSVRGRLESETEANGEETEYLCHIIAESISFVYRPKK